MQAFRKNQIIITALVVMIAIAGYLNFTDKSSEPDSQNVFNIDNNNGQKSGALVPNDEIAIDNTEDEGVDDEQEPETTNEDAQTVATNTDTDDSVGDAIFVNSVVESSFFLNAKIKREQDRGVFKEDLLTVLDNEKLSNEQHDKALRKMLELQDVIEKEAACESLLEAKGFKDVFVRITNNQVDVVINATDLSKQDLAQIEDIVLRKTGLPTENIRISYYKPQK